MTVTQNKKSALFDILKREKLDKMLKRNSSAPNEKPQTSNPENVSEKSSTDKKETQGSKIYKAMDELKLDIRYYFLEDEYREKSPRFISKTRFNWINSESIRKSIWTMREKVSIDTNNLIKKCLWNR